MVPQAPRDNVGEQGHQEPQEPQEWQVFSECCMIHRRCQSPFLASETRIRFVSGYIFMNQYSVLALYGTF